MFPGAKIAQNAYSLLKLRAGFANAARSAWKLTVITAIPTDKAAARANTHHWIDTR